MAVKVEGADQLRELARKLRETDPVIRRALVKDLRPRVKQVTSDVQQTVREAPSEGRKGSKNGKSGYERRAARSLSRMRRISDERAAKVAARTGKHVEVVKAEHRAKQATKAEAGAGLRETIARAVSGSISTGNRDTGVGVRWKTAAAKMPNSQRKLPRDFNSPRGWRHPVFGDRETWVTQRGTPFFDTVIKRHRDGLEAAVVNGMKKAAETILHPESE